MSPRTGRPKTDNPMTERLYVRVTTEEKKEIMEFSSESGFSILEIIRAGIKKLKGQKK
nr:MAG TPA: NikA, BACTERIAL CONJUGATION, RELAXASE, DNA [Caudoviricetes sp.]